ncbi:MAG: hypothetical protein MUE74_11505 [Bacteroidales bacterium]|jgi:hypothetical protein|nr:hypothetical protein [Bacteroidales bacterium]
MKRIIFLMSLCLIPGFYGHSQESDPAWGIKFSGYVKTDIFYDTRQSGASNGLREGHFYLYPDNVLADINGNDLNANPSFHILNIQTRLRGDISGPDAFGAKTSGAIEAEFFGTSEADLNGFRLRHAYVKLDWEKISLLTGQYWHPLFTAESFPGTVSFNTGAPFIPFSRNPQIRLTRKIGQGSLSLTAYSQRDFTSPGPDGNSNKYMRNSSLPGLDLQIRVPAGKVFTGWAGIDYKKLRPELKTAANTETNASVGSMSMFANMKLKTKPLNISLMGIYAQNGSDLMMIGGYAVADTIAPGIKEKKYTNLNTGNLWIDLNTNGKKVTFGLFAGYSKNLGAKDDIEGQVYGRGTNIDHLFRISPRVTLTENRFSFAAEIESTTAAYGTTKADGTVTNTNNVSNLRILISTVYKF